MSHRPANGVLLTTCRARAARLGHREGGAQLLQDGVYGNPHSASPSSLRTAAVMEEVASELLALFSARADEWEVWRARKRLSKAGA